MTSKQEEVKADKKYPLITDMISFNQIFRLLSKMLEPFYPYIAMLAVIAITQTLLMGFRELSVKFIIDKLVTSSGIQIALLWVGALVTGDLAVEISYRISDRMNYKYRPMLKKHIAQTLLSKMFKYSYHFYQNKNPTELASSISNVFEGVEDTIIIIFEEFVHFILLVFVTSLYAMMVSAKISLVFMSWGVLWAIAAVYWGGRMYVLTYNFSQAQVRFEGNISEVFNQMFMVQSYNNTKHEENKVSQWADDVVKSERVLRIMQYKVWIIQGFSFCAIHGALMAYVVYMFSQGLVTPGDVAFIFGLIANLYVSLWDLAKEVREFIDASGKIAQGIHLVKYKEYIEKDDVTKHLKVKKGEIIFENIQFEYPKSKFTYEEEERYLFRGEDTFIIEPGQIVGLVGPSGGGKSTLMKLLLRIFELSAGRILIDGQDISEVSLESLRSKIAVIPQDAGIFEQRTIAENIAYGSMNVTKENMYQIISSAKKAQAHDFIMRLPEQYETILSEYGLNLSGGQKQRVAIARGLLRDASIFLFDEATSALDNITQSSIQEYIGAAMKGKTALVIAHRLHTLKNADNVLVFDQGKLVQQGKHDTLIRKDGLYKKLWYA